jgi:hypothetical protein
MFASYAPRGSRTAAVGQGVFLVSSRALVGAAFF